jgi:hypothetical protein
VEEIAVTARSTAVVPLLSPQAICGDILKIDDYSEFKKEYLASSACLKKELGDNMAKLENID